MDFPHLTYSGPLIDDFDTLDRLPAELRSVLESRNGLIAWSGGFHLRGACQEPTWHSLRSAWLGAEALHSRYPEVLPSDLPIAQEACGDQFLLRGDRVLRLAAETGDVGDLNLDLSAFLTKVRDDGIAFLGLDPLMAFLREGQHLRPGQLLSVYPPFCLKESANGVTLRAVAASDRLAFLADLAKQIHDLPDGAAITLKPTS